MILDLRLKSRAVKFLLVALVLVLLSAGCQGKQAITSSQQSAVSNKQATNNTQAIQVRQMVEGDRSDALFNFYEQENKTALDLLKMGHKLETKSYSGVGEYVLSINGQKETTGKNFWAFYVNGKQAQVGASSYKPKNKDFIEWKLEEIKK